MEGAAALIAEENSLPTLETSSATEAEEFMNGARAAGHEGVVAKDPEAPYEAGRRGRAWIKVKDARTLDLVVLAVERGSGRRAGGVTSTSVPATPRAASSCSARRSRA